MTFTRNVDERLSGARSKFAVTMREFKKGRRDQSDVDAASAELRALLSEVTIERAVTNLSAEIEAGHLNRATYSLISELHSKATRVALSGDLAE